HTVRSVQSIAKPRSTLAIFRFAHGLTQAQLAQAASVSRESVANLEARKYRPRLSTAERLAAALGVQAVDLFPTDDTRALPPAQRLAGIGPTRERPECDPGAHEPT